MSFFHQLQQATADERDRLLAIPVIRTALQGRATRAQYLRFLERAYHHVKHTVPLLMACGARLPDEQEWLRVAVAHYIEEELGHHEWILDDIDAAGGDVGKVRASEADFDTAVMVAYAYDVVTRRNPVGLFGMVYVLESTSVGLATDAARTLQVSLDLPAGALTYLSSHGALDREHIGDFERLVEQLDDADRATVVREARTFYRLYGNVLQSVDAEVQA